MTLVLHNTLALAKRQTLTVSHEHDGGLTIYAADGVFITSAEDALKLSEYIQAHQPVQAEPAPEVRDVRDHATTPREAYDADHQRTVEL